MIDAHHMVDCDSQRYIDITLARTKALAGEYYYSWLYFGLLAVLNNPDGNPNHYAQI
jgi:hypothetical protein